MTLALGLIGCAHIHVPGFIKMLQPRADVHITQVWDHDAARAARRGAELSARVVTDYRQILSNPDIAGVIVCTETDRHEPIVLATAAARKNMFVEKPLAFRSHDARRMADAIEHAGVIFQTGYFMRSSPINRFLKQQVEKNSFGKITHVRASNVHSGAMGGWFDTEWRWMADLAQSGVGGFGDLGTHALDILLWMFGEVDTVTASITNGIEKYPGCDESGEALINFQSGTIGTVAAGWDDVANPVSLQVNGTEGNAVVFREQLYFQSKHIAGADGKLPWTDLPAKLPHAFELYLDALSGQDVPLVSAREAAYRSSVMAAMYDGAKHNLWVTPS